MTTAPALLPDLRTTLVVAVEVSKTAWVVAAHVPGLHGTKIKQRLEPRADALIGAIARLRQRAADKGAAVDRTVAAYESGYSGFRLARALRRAGIEVHVIQPVSVPVDRRVRRAKTDAIDVDPLPRTCLAFLLGEPRVCSMVPVPEEADEDARHPGREREELVAERIALTNRIGGILTTLGVEGYDPLRRDRRHRLGQLRTAPGMPLPAHAEARILRMLDRLELVLGQISVLETQRDAVLERAEQAAPAETMIKRLASLRGIGAQTAALLVREGFVRPLGSAKALGSYAGLVGTPFASGGIEREQGITKAGNRRLRTAVVELASLWLRYQSGSGLATWLRQRLGEAGGRMRKVLVVALARKLLVALWRFATQGLVPEGTAAKAA